MCTYEHKKKKKKLHTGTLKPVNFFFFKYVEQSKIKRGTYT